MRILIIGSNGQLGTDLVKVMANEKLITLTHKDIEVCDFNNTRQILTSNRPDIVINTSAYHKVDECEDNVGKSFQVNTYAVRNLAFVCKDLGCTLIHMSTDYVFGGEKNKPYTEEDAPNPLNVYGVSKLAGEYFIRNVCEKHFIIRSSGLYGVAGASGKGGNFVELMIRLAKENKPIKVVDDQVLTPTYTRELAEKMKQLIQTGKYGLYHITNNGECSWYTFAKKIFDFIGLIPKLSPTTSVQFGVKAKRPKYSVLDNSNLRKIDFDNMRTWKEALREYLKEKEYA